MRHIENINNKKSNHSSELLASKIQPSNRHVRPVYSVVKYTVRLVDLKKNKKRRILYLLSSHIRLVQKIVENLMYYCPLRLVLPSPGPIKMWGLHHSCKLMVTYCTFGKNLMGKIFPSLCNPILHSRLVSMSGSARDVASRNCCFKFLVKKAC